MPSSSLPSVDDISRQLAGLDFFERYVNGQHEGDVYLRTHATRFRETLALLPADLPPQPRVLELGAVPYYMTVLLDTCAGARVDPLSFYEVEQAHVPAHVVTDRSTGRSWTFPFVPVNVERDVFPAQDDTYDLVVCCEILEHLLINPSHMLAESHRVLKPGGYLLVSTPNVVRWENLIALMQGRNINDRYHGNGAYGRHNREFTCAEVEGLVAACGFEVVRAETRDVYPPLFVPGAVPTGREDTVFVLARATGQARTACPGDLYVLMDEYRHVIRSAILAGVDDVGHLGAGWYEPEFEEGAWCRWTRGVAHCALKVDRLSHVDLDVCSHHQDLGTRPVRVTVSARGAEATAVIANWGWQTVTATFAHPIEGPVVDLAIAVDRTWVPRDAGVGDDGRELGIRVRRVAGR